jgi:hypothetical protein
MGLPGMARPELVTVGEAAPGNEIEGTKNGFASPDKRGRY